MYLPKYRNTVQVCEMNCLKIEIREIYLQTTVYWQKLKSTDKTNSDNATKADNIWLIMSVINSCVGVCVRDLDF